MPQVFNENKFCNIVYFITQNDLKQNAVTATMIEEYRILWLRLSQLVSASGMCRTGTGILLFKQKRQDVYYISQSIN
jgi:hypothetical protein